MKTNLFDVTGKEICIGDVVEWSDIEGERTAKVIFEKGQVGFLCIGNSKEKSVIGHKFMMGNFIYANTEQYLRIIEEQQGRINE